MITAFCRARLLLPALAAGAVATVSPAGMAPLVAVADAPLSSTHPGTGGGVILTQGFDNSSVAEATATLLRRVHSKVGARPTIVQVVRNARDHSLALLFTVNHAGTPYTGMVVVTSASDSHADGTALYDTASRFPSTVGPMMHDITSMTLASNAKPPGSMHRAAAEPLVDHPFGDGTGSIAMPADWQLRGAGGASASAIAPDHQTNVLYNRHFYALDYSNPRSAGVLNTYAGKALNPVPLAYTTDPVKAWVGIYAGLAKRGGFTPDVHVLQQSSSGGVSTFSGTLGTGPKQLVFSANAFVLPPDIYGLWQVSDSHVMMRPSDVAREGATAVAVLNSVRVNSGALAAQGDAIRHVFAQQFATQIAGQKEQNAVTRRGTDLALARDREAQEGMHRQAVSMENYSLDRAVVVDTRTGEHNTIDSGFADDLVHYNGNYQKVPAQNLLRGIDY